MTLYHAHSMDHCVERATRTHTTWWRSVEAVESGRSGNQSYASPPTTTTPSTSSATTTTTASSSSSSSSSSSPAAAATTTRTTTTTSSSSSSSSTTTTTMTKQQPARTLFSSYFAGKGSRPQGVFTSPWETGSQQRRKMSGLFKGWRLLGVLWESPSTCERTTQTMQHLDPGWLTASYC